MSWQGTKFKKMVVCEEDMSSVLVGELLKDYYSLDKLTQIDIDSAIAVCVKNDEFSPNERVVLYLFKEQYTIREIADVISMSHESASRLVTKVISKIAPHMGEGYQDSTLFDEIAKRLGRPLSMDEYDFCSKVFKNGRAKDVNIFNFRIKDGKIIRGQNKTERQVEL
jgi:hypothetical protein